LSDQVILEYHRPPDRTDRFVQKLVYESADVLVTFLEHTPMKRPMVIDDRLALEAGSPVVWFTFPGLLHDIGRFHTATGAFTGLYANIMEPVELQSRLKWRATDLFVDVWVPVVGEPRILDRDELAAAIQSDAISAETGARAQAEAERLLALHHQGSWPPAIVNEWPIERVFRSI
jgi:predicted RNA-binding protein associated with RNAse of E/G family